MSEVDSPASDSPASDSSAGLHAGGLEADGLTFEEQRGCGYFPRARYNPGNRPFRTDRVCNCIIYVLSASVHSLGMFRDIYECDVL